jgi:hypothetical protein
MIASAPVLAAALAGCGVPGSGQNGPNLDDLPPLLAFNLCVEVQACFGKPAAHQQFGDDGCLARLEAQIEDSDFSYTQAAIDKGRVHYDPSKVDACLKSIEGLGCKVLTDRPLKSVECQLVFTGAVELGGKCELDSECMGVAFCKRVDNKCPGKCSALLKAGAACDSADQCQKGLICPDSDKTCAAPVASGDVCGGSVGGDCAPGSGCIGEDAAKGTTGTCMEAADLYKAKLGASCDLQSGELCEEGLSCVAMLASGTQGAQVSFDCEKPAASGATCRVGFPTPCPTDEFCDVPKMAIDGMCRPLPKAGEACSGLSGLPDCSSGLICDTDSKCHPVNRLGQPCVSDKGCASQLCSKGKCAKKDACDL